MLHPYQILVPLLSLFFVRVDLTDLIPLTVPVESLQVLDGDTVVAGKGSYFLRVRLLGIDAPEKGQPFLSGKGDAGVYSTECLKELLLKEAHYNVRIEGFDMYGRILGNVNDVVKRALQEGCAGLYPHARFSSKRERGEHLRIQARAQRERVGVWGRGGYQRPMLWRKLSKRSAVRPLHR